MRAHAYAPALFGAFLMCVTKVALHGSTGPSAVHIQCRLTLNEWKTVIVTVNSKTFQALHILGFSAYTVISLAETRTGSEPQFHLIKTPGRTARHYALPPGSRPGEGGGLREVFWQAYTPVSAHASI